MCKKKLKNLKDKMREVTNKLPKTKSGQPAFEKGANVVRWPFYEPMLFMKDQFLGREMQGSFHTSTQDESLQEDSVLPTPVDSDDDTSAESPFPSAEKPKLTQPKPGRMTKKASLEEQFLSVEREKLANLKKVVAAEECKEPADEWGPFCSSLACDLRKLKDPYLVMQVRGDINRIVNDAVLKQLQRNAPRPATSPHRMPFRQDQFVGTYNASSQEITQQEDEVTYQLLD
ncbi:hypothetical protein BaRGS_00018191 [Batillaria attramentaria]|uniref:Uncharacterized protein n=1 Tax=Batillaria attramentaria TaxID=370345 RepID=A0ABD0KU75_9CAEN